MWLEEIRDPKWHGTPAERAAEAYRELRSRPSVDRWDGLAGGESIREFVARIRLGAEKFLEERGRPPRRRRPAGLGDRRAGRADRVDRPRRHQLDRHLPPARAARRLPGSGTGMVLVTRRSAGSRRSRSATATRSASPRSPTSSTSRRTTAHAERRAAIGSGDAARSIRSRLRAAQLQSRLLQARRSSDRRHDPPRRPPRPVSGACRERPGR